MEASRSKPLIALVVGDPAGISPELTALLARDAQVADAVRLVVVGDRRIVNQGAAISGTAPDLEDADLSRSDLGASRGHVLVDIRSVDPAAIVLGTANEAGGASALANFRNGLDLAVEGRVDGVCYTPFNKSAMRMSYPPYEDEAVFSAEHIGIDRSEVAEFNIQERLWSARVTSHVPLSGVASLMTVDRILNRLRLSDRAMSAAGFRAPRIAVAGLNPHAGDGGNFGREEIDVIGPAVSSGQAQGINCSGPYPPDTVFVRAKTGEFDAVLTMYHDQGQIAMKLIGFYEGVVYFAGLPFPLTTPAHGTAYDIVGKGKANIGAGRAAVLLTGKLAANGFVGKP